MFLIPHIHEMNNTVYREASRWKGIGNMNKKISRLAIVLTIVSVLFFFAGDKGLTAAKMQGYKAMKVFAQVSSSSPTPGFSIYETDNFIIKYTEADADIVGDIAAVFEKSRNLEGQRYGYYPQGKTTVFVYGDQQSMWDHQRAVRGQAVMGLYNMGIIHILSPKAYFSQKQVADGDIEKGGPILHEYVHSVIDEKSGGNLELWLTEGIALYEEYEVDGVEWAPGFTYERYFSAAELRRDFMQLDETQSYEQSVDIVKGLVRNYGREKIIELLGKLKNGDTMDEAFLEIYGSDLNRYIDSGAWRE